MRINNYSILDRSIYGNLKNQQLQSISTSANKKSSNTNLDSQSDNISIDIGKQLIAKMKLLSSTTEIDGNNVGQLAANNNILQLNKGSYYKLQACDDTTSIYTVSDDGNIYMPYSKVGIDNNFTLPSSYYEKVSKTSRLLSSLAQDSSAFEVRTGGYSNTEIKDVLNSVGIKPGWFKVNSEDKSNSFYLTNDGSIYPKYQIEAQTRAFKQTNWLKDEEGYSSNSQFIIDGKTYKLDENGYLNLPDGVDCVMENIKIIK